MTNQSTRLKKIESYREKERIRQRRSRAKVRAWIAEEKSSKGCSNCGESHPACLHFHHVDPSLKLFTINRGVMMHKPMDSLKAEMEKCILLCANCHAKLHWNDRAVELEEW